MIDEIMEGSMRILYESTITSIGSSVQGLLDEKICIFFAENAPEELKEISVCHTHEKPPWYNFRSRDIIRIGDQELEILAIGKVAMKTFKELGHFSIKFRQRDDIENMLPGDVLVEFNGNLSLQEGMKIQVVRI
ncbi:MAG: PTS glucitol/sorbitol transporter subunit IIA [Bacillota bacterium]|jgi:PTS system glucitol/sorbitol-specific IIA component|nr:hypothetical protein [Bacillota bacterium]HOC05983.1 PTS glucitol/sorbitol transporter subunit IIA [Bacillota bacterium]HPZ22035.1 PTS glucitol/sorbitol transporter subunit IIA [Bacillota bacterium]HQD20000.1 PTS glucitol/sorbitol transporter subunit IIA [Bacillota bacterium]